MESGLQVVPEPQRRAFPVAMTLLSLPLDRDLPIAVRAAAGWA
jgi:hypothetical protein